MLGILAVALAHSLVAAEISGAVQQASGQSVTIRVEGDLLPEAGDKAEIFFKLPGAEDEISVATGSVLKVDRDAVQLNIANATGDVAKDQLVRITSAKPQKRSAVAATTSAPAPTSASTSSPSAQISANQGRDPGFVFLDLNKVFKEHPKTKIAEAEINQAKNAAKKEYDERATSYTALVEEINALNKKLNSKGASNAAGARERDGKLASAKEMEREINEFRTSREKELQADALKRRDEIVADMTSSLKRLGGETAGLVLDISGTSKNTTALFVFSPPAGNMSERLGAALKGEQSSPFEPVNGVKIAFVDLNYIFKRFAKTKTAEDEVNATKSAAKKTYDERAAAYKKALAKIESSSGAARQSQTAKVKTMEREINGWRTAKEKELQEQATKSRAAIVAEMMKTIGAKLGAGALVIDSSGESLNNVPTVLFRKEIPDFSDEIVAALNGSAAPTGAASNALASSTNLRFGTVDMDRAFQAMPEKAAAETEINASKAKMKAETTGADAATIAKKEKELQELSEKLRKGIVDKLSAALQALAQTSDYNMILDSSGKSLNGVPFLLSTHDLPDLTDELIARAK